MPGTLLQIADGLEARLATISGLRVFDHVPDVFAAPCAFVLPDAIEFWQSFQTGTPEVTFTVTVVVGRASERTAQKALYEFMSFSGDRSIRAAIEGDRTLGGVVQTCIVESAQNIRMVQQDSQSFLAADLTVRLHA